MPDRFHLPPSVGRMLGDLSRRVGVLEREKSKPGGLVGGPGLDATITALAPDAWWKLDDASGNAVDSLNGHNLGPNGSPTRGAAAGPPGTLTTQFTSLQGFGGNGISPSYSPSIAGDFSCAGWLYRVTSNVSIEWGQGDPMPAGGNGWGLSTSGTTLSAVFCESGGTQHSFAASTPIALSTSYHVGVTRVSGVWRLYVNGAVQPTTYSGTGATTSFSQPFFIMYNNLTGLSYETIRESYVTFFPTRGLSGAEMLSLYTAGITQGIPASGLVPVTDGSGNVTYQAITESLISTSDVTTDNVTSSKHGFAPKAPADATKFLNGDTTPAYAQVKDSDLSTSNITTNNVTTSKHGFAPILPNDATKYLDGTGAYTVPAGGGGGGSGAVTQICNVLLGANQASFDTNTILGGNISGLYNHLLLEYVLRSDNAGINEDAMIVYNNDSTAANYNTQRLDVNGATVSGAETHGTLAGGFLAIVSGNTAPAGYAGAGSCRIQGYKGTTFNKVGNAYSLNNNSASAGGNQTQQHSHIWLSTAAITRIKVYPLVGTNWLTGSLFSLYGIT